MVEAYWIGSPLLDGVSADDLAASLRVRFRPRLRADGWRWLAGKPGDGAVPVHAFHVLDVFPRVGLLRSGATDRALEVMDACRIRWGRVLERDGDALVVNAVPIAMVAGGSSSPRHARNGSRPGATAAASSMASSRRRSRSTGPLPAID